VLPVLVALVLLVLLVLQQMARWPWWWEPAWWTCEQQAVLLVLLAQLPRWRWQVLVRAWWLQPLALVAWLMAMQQVVLLHGPWLLPRQPLLPPLRVTWQCLVLLLGLAQGMLAKEAAGEALCEAARADGFITQP
jgi:hypothetical protein